MFSSDAVLATSYDVSVSCTAGRLRCDAHISSCLSAFSELMRSKAMLDSQSIHAEIFPTTNLVHSFAERTMSERVNSPVLVGVPSPTFRR